MTKNLFPLIQSIFDEVLKNHPEKDKAKEEKMAQLAQELLKKLWEPLPICKNFWQRFFTQHSSLPQTIFDRIASFRENQKFTETKEEIWRIMFYTSRAFYQGTEMLARACYLFYHSPLAFRKYSTTEIDFDKDIYRSIHNKIFISPSNVDTVPPFQSEQEKQKIENRRLPLLSFAPIKLGIHPCLIDSTEEIEKYKELFSETFLRNFSTNPVRYEPLKKLLCIEQPESNYPDKQHRAIVVAIDEFNRRLRREPVKICVHMDGTTKTDIQRIKE